MTASASFVLRAGTSKLPATITSRLTARSPQRTAKSNGPRRLRSSGTGRMPQLSTSIASNALSSVAILPSVWCKATGQSKTAASVPAVWSRRCSAPELPGRSKRSIPPKKDPLSPRGLPSPSLFVCAADITTPLPSPARIVERTPPCKSHSEERRAPRRRRIAPFLLRTSRFPLTDTSHKGIEKVIRKFRLVIASDPEA